MKFVLACLMAASTMAQYCSGGNTLPGDSNLGSVAIDSICGEINDDTDCPGGTGVVNVDQTAELQPGGSYTLTFFATTCDTAVYARVVKAWIDFNNDGTYSQDEALMDAQSVPNENTPQQISVSFTPPCTAAIGEIVGMRIVVVEGSSGDPDPCAPFSYGGAKDFKIEILGKNGAACSGFDITSSNECNGARNGSGGLDFGGIALIIITVSLFLYVTGGCLFLRYKKGTTGMKESCVHFSFWASMLSLSRDGFMFTKAKVVEKFKGGGTGYEDLEVK